MEKTAWGYNTDLNAVFMNLLLPLAIKHQIKQEDMIKRLFIFSDMQFDEGCGTSANPAQWKTNHDAIKKAYEDAGYDMPQIVYWDLANLQTMPVTAEIEGTALMNGFSPSMLKVFMGEEELDVDAEDWEIVRKKKEEEFNPLNVMKKAVGRKSFDRLVVVD